MDEAENGGAKQIEHPTATPALIRSARLRTFWVK